LQGFFQGKKLVKKRFYPTFISSYDPYLWIFETHYEDFIIDLFSD